MTENSSAPVDAAASGKLWLRVSLAGTILLAFFIIWASHFYLTRQLSAQQAAVSGVRATLHAGILLSTIEQNQLAAQLLSRDSLVVRAVQAENDAIRFSSATAANQRLEAYREQIGSGAILLLDKEGRAVSASDSALIGRYDGDQAHFKAALATGAETAFGWERNEAGTFSFFVARAIRNDDELLGVITIDMDMSANINRWALSRDMIAVTNEAGEVLMSSERDGKAA